MWNSAPVLFTALLIVIVSLGCGGSSQPPAIHAARDGKYDSAFPHRDSSRQLREIVTAVKRVICSSYYAKYEFDSDQRIFAGHIDSLVLAQTQEKSFFTHSTSGTATTIHFQDRRAVLLTCAHVFDHPDTLLTYYGTERKSQRSSVESIAIRQDHQIYISDLPADSEIRLLAMDREHDIAILLEEFEDDLPYTVPVIRYPFGRAKELDWGTFVYLVGYPKGHKMVTRAIVSEPNRDGEGAFYLDALFNPGFSGGIVLALRDGVPNFEIVGIVHLASADAEHILVPSERDEYPENLPYEGEIYVKYKKTVNYGITRATPAERILSFLSQNRDKLMQAGIDSVMTGKR